MFSVFRLRFLCRWGLLGLVLLYGGCCHCCVDGYIWEGFISSSVNFVDRKYFLAPLGVFVYTSSCMRSK